MVDHRNYNAGSPDKYLTVNFSLKFKDKKLYSSFLSDFIKYLSGYNIFLDSKSIESFFEKSSNKNPKEIDITISLLLDPKITVTDKFKFLGISIRNMQYSKKFYYLFTLIKESVFSMSADFVFYFYTKNISERKGQLINVPEHEYPIIHYYFSKGFIVYYLRNINIDINYEVNIDDEKEAKVLALALATLLMGYTRNQIAMRMITYQTLVFSKFMNIFSKNNNLINFLLSLLLIEYHITFHIYLKNMRLEELLELPHAFAHETAIREARRIDKTVMPIEKIKSFLKCGFHSGSIDNSDIKKVISYYKCFYEIIIKEIMKHNNVKRNYEVLFRRISIINNGLDNKNVSNTIKNVIFLLTEQSNIFQLFLVLNKLKDSLKNSVNVYVIYTPKVFVQRLILEDFFKILKGDIIKKLKLNNNININLFNIPLSHDSNIINNIAIKNLIKRYNLSLDNTFMFLQGNLELIFSILKAFKDSLKDEQLTYSKLVHHNNVLIL